MKERPILMNGAMVRATLPGAKTQTRRIMKQQPHAESLVIGGYAISVNQRRTTSGTSSEAVSIATARIADYCPYGKVGDRLYVRETWAQPTTLDPGPTFYRADYPDCVPAHFENVPPAKAIRWTPSIHMPRALSRILLEIVCVRVERLKDISEADAKAEGAPDYEEGTDAPPPDDASTWSYQASFQRLWESINGAGSWEANPWVWVVEFKRVPLG